ncbi:MAG: hypothetical protein JXO72_12175 [Vicinamibacteria bacterium]|nr:hypothetical protein [Vicinamibacteria bacterium]
MTRAKVAPVWAMISGVLVTLLGLFHNRGVMDVFHGYGFDRLASLSGRGFIYMYLGVGIAWIGAGLLLFVSGRGLRRGASWAWPLGSAAAVFMLIFGVGAMVIMPDNPPTVLIAGCAILAVPPFALYRPSRR